MAEDTKALHDYILHHTTQESETIRALVADSEKELDHIDMLSGNTVGQLLALLIRLGGFSRVLEVGSFTGYGTLQMAQALPDEGLVVTLEMNEHYRSVSEKFFNRPPFDKKVRQIMGPALESIPSLEGPFDLVFLDADKANYPAYFESIRPLLRSGGLLVADNVFWNGEAIEAKTRKGEAVDRFNRKVQEDPAFTNVMLPVRDGLLIARKN
ncbi:MAG: O-methyltransferase [Bacteroidota bacterium]